MQPVEDWESGNVTASGGGLECACSVFLPDSNFPADRVQHMQQVTTNLKREVEIQMNNVSMKLFMSFDIIKKYILLKLTVLKHRVNKHLHV